MCAPLVVVWAERGGDAPRKICVQSPVAMRAANWPAKQSLDRVQYAWVGAGCDHEGRITAKPAHLAYGLRAEVVQRPALHTCLRYLLWSGAACF